MIDELLVIEYYSNILFPFYFGEALLREIEQNIMGNFGCSFHL